MTQLTDDELDETLSAVRHKLDYVPVDSEQHELLVSAADKMRTVKKSRQNETLEDRL